MKIINKLMALLLIAVITTGLISANGSYAKDNGSKTPTIKVKRCKNGTDVKLTIGKTKDADGYEVWISGDISYKGYKTKPAKDQYDPHKFQFERVVYDDTFIKVAEINNDGSKKRTVKLRLPNGKISIKVRSYKKVIEVDDYGEWHEVKYNQFSTTKKVKIKKAAEGYKNTYDFSKVQQGDIIKFGSYEQDNDYSNGKEPIEWIVIEKTNKSLFVMSKYVIDALAYDISNNDVTWETCTLREWLNGEFYNKAFNKAERKLIQTVILENKLHDENSNYEEDGNETNDKVFLLSYSDMIKKEYGFSQDVWSEDIMRCCKPTLYAIAQGEKASSNGNSWWRLRESSPYALVYGNGSIRCEDEDWYEQTNFWENAIRPALYIQIQ